MSERSIESNEASESLDRRAETSEDQRALDSATFQPEAAVEQNQSYEQAETVQAAFTAVVDSRTQASGEQVSDAPTPAPDPAEDRGEDSADPEKVDLALDSPAESAAASPLPIPQPVESMEETDAPTQESKHAQDAASESEGASPLPIPQPAEGMQEGEADTETVDLRRKTASEGRKADSRATEKRTESEIEPSTGGITTDEAGREELPPQEMQVELPEQQLAGQDTEGDDILGGFEQGLPGTEGFGDIPGLGDDPFGRGMSDPFGGTEGGPGGIGSGDPFGEDPLGGFGFPGIPGFTGLPGEDMGGMGGGTPGGPGLINFSRTPIGGGISQGGGRNPFWKFNNIPGQEMRFTHAKEITGLAEEAAKDLQYVPNWSPPDPTDSKTVVDPFTGGVEEWGTATTEDYEEREREMEDFAKAQLDYEKERLKQEKARQRIQHGDEASMPRPDEDGSDVGPVRPEDIDVAKVGGILVSDPAYTQWGPTTSAVDFSKTPGGVTDPGYEDSGSEKAGGVRAGPEQVTDPPEGEAGKKG